jgi:hypothetical protein
MIVTALPRLPRITLDGPLPLAAAHLPETERRILARYRANALLVGGTPSTEAVLLALEPVLLDPLALWHPGAPLTLPERGGTLVLRNVGRLSLADQSALVDWFNGDSYQTQVISTSPNPIYPLIDRGRFSEALYYRLNTVYLELKDG